MSKIPSLQYNKLILLATGAFFIGLGLFFLSIEIFDLHQKFDLPDDGVASFLGIFFLVFAVFVWIMGFKLQKKMATLEMDRTEGIDKTLQMIDIKLRMGGEIVARLSSKTAAVYAVLIGLLPMAIFFFLEIEDSRFYLSGIPVFVFFWWLLQKPYTILNNEEIRSFNLWQKKSMKLKNIESIDLKVVIIKNRGAVWGHQCSLTVKGNNHEIFVVRDNISLHDTLKRKNERFRKADIILWLINKYNPDLMSNFVFLD